jgi:hypothetical protein
MQNLTSLDIEVYFAHRALKKFVRKANASTKYWRCYPHDYTGLCAIASAGLFKKLKELGIVAKFVVGYDVQTVTRYAHCWIEHFDKVIDITCSQFYMPCPSIMSWRQAEKSYLLKYTKELHEFEELKDIKDHFDNYRWPKDQNPFRGNKVKFRVP